MVLDNLKVHKSKKLDEIYDPDFKEILLPPYSSALIPIERLWSLVKQQWQKSSHQFTHGSLTYSYHGFSVEMELVTRYDG